MQGIAADFRSLTQRFGLLLVRLLLSWRSPSRFLVPPGPVLCRCGALPVDGIPGSLLPL